MGRWGSKGYEALICCNFSGSAIFEEGAQRLDLTQSMGRAIFVGHLLGSRVSSETKTHHFAPARPPMATCKQAHLQRHAPVPEVIQAHWSTAGNANAVG